MSHRRDLNLRRSERKENAERFSELASPPAGGRSGADPRSGYADVLSPAPLNERAPSNGGFFVMHNLLGRVS